MFETAPSPEKVAPDGGFRARHALLKRLADVVSLPASRINAFERAVTGDLLMEMLRLASPEDRRRVAVRLAPLAEIPNALVRMLLGSCSVVSAWQGGRLVGIGRATSDGVFRAVLWDVVVAEEHQGRGLGRRIVQALLASPAVAASERVYLMTTNSAGFYGRLGFSASHAQHLMVWHRQQQSSG